MADTANAVPLFGQSIEYFKPILKQLPLSNHDAAEWKMVKNLSCVLYAGWKLQTKGLLAD